MDKWLREIPEKSPQVEDNNISTKEQQENGGAGTSSAPSSSATLQGKNSGDLIRTEEKSAKNA